MLGGPGYTRLVAESPPSEAPSGPNVVAGVGCGCGTLLALHVLGFAVVGFFGLLFGAPFGDPGFPRFALAVYSALFPLVQVAYGGLAALIALVLRRRAVAVGMAIGTALTFITAGTCAAIMVSGMAQQTQW